MKATDLDLRELLQFEPKGGLLHFAGQRALLFDAVALGILRAELIGQVGLTGAKGILTRFGYAHGWRTAESLKDAFPWDSDLEWKRAGGRLHTLWGLLVVEQTSRRTDLFAESVWHDTYEADQHIMHFGQADMPVCWTLSGFASGYLSYCNGKEIYCLEEKCRGKGDAVCTLVGKPREEWGSAIEPEVPFYEKACLDKALLRTTQELKRVEQRLRSKKKELEGRGDGKTFGLVVHSDGMVKAVDLAKRVARVDSTVLLTGESGVGKERLARLIHEESTRTAGPFVAVNCGAVPEGLLESELFGHAKGAFTGAANDRPGLFEAAHGGTLLLDEIGEVPLSMQVKLLRALQQREVRRVGENKNRTMDVRVIAATNRDLPVEVQAGRFRQDLYYRLRVVEIRVPALRERRDDILPLARTFLMEAAGRMSRKVTGFTTEAAHQMVKYGWPGNVRELENAMERAVVLAKGSRIGVDDLPEEVALAISTAVAAGGVRSLAEVEREYILSVLKVNKGNRAETATQLGIGVATLYRKLKEYQQEG